MAKEQNQEEQAKSQKDTKTQNTRQSETTATAIQPQEGDVGQSTHKKGKVTYFKLNVAKAGFWSPDDGGMILSLPQAAEHGVKHLYGSINETDKATYDRVKIGFETHNLVEVTKKEYESNKDSSDKVAKISLNAKIEEQFVMDRKVESILRNEGKEGEENIIQYIENQSDANILANMMMVEEAGKKRKNVTRALDVALRKSNNSGMSQIIGEGKERQTFSGQQIRRESINR